MQQKTTGHPWPNPGFMKIPDSTYHGGNLDNIVSSSMLKNLAKSPLYFKYSMDNKKYEPSEAMKIGSGFHAALLEPKSYEENFAVMEQHDARTKEGKAYRLEFEVNSIGKTVLKSDQHNKIMNMISALNKNSNAKELLSSGTPELAHFWTDEKTGLFCRSKIDFINEEKARIIDIKTTSDLSIEGFSRQASNLLYHMQASFYLDGAKHVYKKDFNEFYIIAIDTNEPHDSAVFLYDQESIENGRNLYLKLLNKYKDCVEKNYWPGLADENTIDLRLPNWLKKDTTTEETNVEALW